MRICVYGAGAIGGLLGAKLAAAGQEVSLVARGPHLAAIKERGLELREGGNASVTRPRATQDPAELGVQDFVIVTLKAHQVPAAVPVMQPLLGPETAVVFAVNGVPWWYFHGLEGPHAGRRLASVVPGTRSGTASGPSGRSAASSIRRPRSSSPGSSSWSRAIASASASRAAHGRRGCRRSRRP